jgi:hypothetical protein
MPGKHIRRSDRVALSLPLEVTGSDCSGQSFLEQTHTLIISRHGASVVLSRRLAPGDEVLLYRSDTKKKALAHVVGQIGGRGGGYVYGLALNNPEDWKFWGIWFPPLEESEDAVVRVLLECDQCSRREVVYLDELEAEVFDANRSLGRRCGDCNSSTLWTQSRERPTTPREGGAAVGGHRPRNERKQLRIRVKMAACIRQPGFDEETVVVEDVSRGGLSFHSCKEYLKGSRIEVALPYTPGVANVFVPARILHARPVPGENVNRYGVAYIKAHKGWSEE